MRHTEILAVQLERLYLAAEALDAAISRAGGVDAPAAGATEAAGLLAVIRELGAWRRQAVSRGELPPIVDPARLGAALAALSAPAPTAQAFPDLPDADPQDKPDPWQW
jgi:hypothetical protein